MICFESNAYDQKSLLKWKNNHCKCSILISDAEFAVQVHYWSKSSINHMVNYTFNRYCSRKALYKLGMHWFISKIIIMKIPFQIIFISSVFSMRHGNIHWYIFQKNVVFDILNGSIFVADRVQCSGRNLPCEQNVLF